MLLFFFDLLQVLQLVGIHDLALHFAVIAENLFDRLYLDLDHIRSNKALGSVFELLLLFLFSRVHRAEREGGGIVRLEDLVDNIIGNARLTLGEGVCETARERRLLPRSLLISCTFRLTNPIKALLFA